MWTKEGSTRHVNRQFDDYIVCSAEENVPPFYVCMVGATEAISEHPDVTAAVRAIMRYQAADLRRSKSKG